MQFLHYYTIVIHTAILYVEVPHYSYHTATLASSVHVDTLFLKRLSSLSPNISFVVAIPLAWTRVKQWQLWSRRLTLRLDSITMHDIVILNVQSQAQSQLQSMICHRWHQNLVYHITAKLPTVTRYGMSTTSIVRSHVFTMSQGAASVLLT